MPGRVSACDDLCVITVSDVDVVGFGSKGLAEVRKVGNKTREKKGSALLYSTNPRKMKVVTIGLVQCAC